MLLSIGTGPMRELKRASTWFTLSSRSEGCPAPVRAQTANRHRHSPQAVPASTPAHGVLPSRTWQDYPLSGMIHCSSCDFTPFGYNSSSFTRITPYRVYAVNHAASRVAKTKVPTNANTAKVSINPSIAILNGNVPSKPSLAVGAFISFAAHAP